MTPWKLMTVGERVAWVAGHWRLAIPVFVAIFGYVLMTFPLFAPLPVMPNIALLLVFFWTLYRPSQMPPWSGFLVGFAGDIMLGTPVGANAFLMPLLILVAGSYDVRVKRETWVTDWLFAIPLILVYHLCLWKLAGWITVPIPALPLLTQAAATAAIYPFIGLIFVGAQRRWAAA